MKQKRVLVIDDDEQVGGSIVRTLERAGYVAEYAPNTAVGLGTAIATPPDAVVIDVMVNNGKDGFALAEQLHTLPETRSAKIVLITTPAGLKDRRKNTREKNFLTKPIKPSELIAMLQQLGL